MKHGFTFDEMMPKKKFPQAQVGDCFLLKFEATSEELRKFAPQQFKDDGINFVATLIIPGGRSVKLEYVKIGPKLWGFVRAESIDARGAEVMRGNVAKALGEEAIRRVDGD